MGNCGGKQPRSSSFQVPPKPHLARPEDKYRVNNEAETQGSQRGLNFDKNGDFLRQLTGDVFDFTDLKKSNNPTLQRLGTNLDLAFKDPIAAIKQDYGIEDEDAFFNVDEEQVLAGPFSRVALLMTDKAKGKWVDTLIRGQISLVLLKDVGVSIAVVRIMPESEEGEVGDVVFEYEIPLNVQMEKLTPNFMAINIVDKGEYFGFNFTKSVADAAMFNMKLTELVDNLEADSMKLQAIKALVVKHEKELEQAQVAMAKTIDTQILLKGTGTQEHQRELYKVLALAGIKLEDMNKASTMDMIQDVITDFIADDEMNADDVEFAARSLAFRATEGTANQRGGSRTNTRGAALHKRGSNAPPATLQKKVTWGANQLMEEENKLSVPHRGIVQVDSLENSAAENVSEDDAKDNSLFGDNNILLRQSAKSEIKSISDQRKQKMQKVQRKSQVLRDREKQLKRQTRQNEKTKKQLQDRELALSQKKSVASTSDTTQKMQVMEEEKRLLQDQLKFAQQERDQFKQQLEAQQTENKILEKKLNSDTIHATRNLLMQSTKSAGGQNIVPAAPVQRTPPPPPPSGMRGPPRPPPPSGARGPPRPPGRGPVRPPPVKKSTAPAAPQKSLAEQLAEQAAKLKKPGSSAPKTQAPKQLTLAEQLQQQLEQMARRTEEKDAARKASLKQEPEPVETEPEEDNKAWNLTRQLKERMKALNGPSRRSNIATEKKKRKYKEQNDLDSGDTTPSDFDPNDSDLDSSEQDSTD